MATTTISGSTVTFSNSGAAANITKTGNEDETLAFTFDVLAASGGGKNTTIYSVDDGIKNDDGGAAINVTNKAFAEYNKDLLIQDGVGIESAETSAKGAKFWIGADNKIHYDAAALSVEINALGAGEKFTDTIQYTIKMSNGTLSVGTLTVVISGTNDAPVIDLVGSDSAAATLTETDAGLKTCGTLTVTDADTSDSITASVTGVTLSGSSGKLSAADVQAMLTVTSGAIAADAGDTHNLAWQFNSGSEAFDFLAAGEHLTLTYTVKVDDGHRGAATREVVITIHGSNDAAVITGTSTAELTETDQAQSTGGKLKATDVDSSADFVVQTDVAGSNGYGKFSIAADGTWTYVMDDAHDEFVEGLDYTDSITVHTADGTAQLITVTIHGSNDAAVITGTSTAELTETDQAQSTGGKLKATDVDSS
ncbi:VCBS domain-containing protein, partial [Mesorhizobium sp. KR2-14]|uniref:VCBS domain-containing protein n=1 Tax=Mesorhizobium sp. KR2-14 TaxID=3156610 RepID=UPI0032B3349F